MVVTSSTLSELKSALQAQLGWMMRRIWGDDRGTPVHIRKQKIRINWKSEKKDVERRNSAKLLEAIFLDPLRQGLHQRCPPNITFLYIIVTSYESFFYSNWLLCLRNRLKFSSTIEVTWHVFFEIQICGKSIRSRDHFCDVSIERPDRVASESGPFCIAPTARYHDVTSSFSLEREFEVLTKRFRSAWSLEAILATKLVTYNHVTSSQPRDVIKAVFNATFWIFQFYKILI